MLNQMNCIPLWPWFHNELNEMYSTMSMVSCWIQWTVFHYDHGFAVIHQPCIQPWSLFHVTLSALHSFVTIVVCHTACLVLVYYCDSPALHLIMTMVLNCFTSHIHNGTLQSVHSLIEDLTEDHPNSFKPMRGLARCQRLNQPIPLLYEDYFIHHEIDIWLTLEALYFFVFVFQLLAVFLFKASWNERRRRR